jgi:outer membrane protein, heavy metal efflux system
MPHSALTLGALVVSLVVVSPAIVPAWASQAQAEQAPHDVATRVKARTGAVPRVTGTVQPNIPAGVVLDDGLTPDEAVAIALWNNAAFQVSVSQLGFARADLLDAGVLTNPVLSLLFPIGPKQLEATLRWPVEVLWERPRRVAAARLASDAAAERLVQAGLDLVAAVRIAYADLSLATDVERLANEGAALLTRIDVLTQSRLAAGDIGELEARAARVDMARGEHDAARTAHDIVIARERLRLLLGLMSDSTDWTALMLVSPVAQEVRGWAAFDRRRDR